MVVVGLVISSLVVFYYAKCWGQEQQSQVWHQRACPLVLFGWDSGAFGTHALCLAMIAVLGLAT